MKIREWLIRKLGGVPTLGGVPAEPEKIEFRTSFRRIEKVKAEMTLSLEDMMTASGIVSDGNIREEMALQIAKILFREDMVTIECRQVINDPFSYMWKITAELDVVRKRV